MKRIDALTTLTLAMHEPDTYASLLFFGANTYFGAHLGCAYKQHGPNTFKEVYLLDGDEPVGPNRVCYYCGSEWNKRAAYRYIPNIKPF